MPPCAEEVDYVKDQNCHPAQEQSATEKLTFNLVQLKQIQKTVLQTFKINPQPPLHPPLQ